MRVITGYSLTPVHSLGLFTTGPLQSGSATAGSRIPAGLREPLPSPPVPFSAPSISTVKPESSLKLGDLGKDVHFLPSIPTCGFVMAVTSEAQQTLVPSGGRGGGRRRMVVLSMALTLCTNVALTGSHLFRASPESKVKRKDPVAVRLYIQRAKPCTWSNILDYDNCPCPSSLLLIKYS